MNREVGEVLRLLMRWQRQRGREAEKSRHREAAVFLFFYFLFQFFTKIYFRFGNLQKYTSSAPLLGGRDPAARRQGLTCKKKTKKITDRSLGTGRPAAGLPGRPAAGRPAPTGRPAAGDRLSHPYIRVGWSPHPSFASLQFQKPRKKREGGREAKPCRIFEPATAGNQNSSTLYK